MLEPDLVVGLQRGEELDPILGVIERFFGDRRRSRCGVHPAVVSTSVEQRMEQREHAMARYFEGELQRFRVKPTVFMPTPAAAVRPRRSSIGCWWVCPTARAGSPGSGYLEYVPEDGALRLISPVADPPKALRLGSVRLEEQLPRQARRPPEPLRNRVKG